MGHTSRGLGRCCLPWHTVLVLAACKHACNMARVQRLRPPPRSLKTHCPRHPSQNLLVFQCAGLKGKRKQLRESWVHHPCKLVKLLDLILARGMRTPWNACRSPANAPKSLGQPAEHVRQGLCCAGLHLEPCASIARTFMCNMCACTHACM